LNDLDKQQETIWEKIASLILTKKPNYYDEAVQLLVDLRDLGKKNKTTIEFNTKLLEVRKKHSRKPGLMSRIDSAGLKKNLL